MVVDDSLALDAYSRAVVSVVERAGPAVVAIRVRRHGRHGAVEGAGSGFLVTPDGYLVTNSHVVRGAGEVLVALADGSELVARTVGEDPPTDLAVLRVPSGSLPFLPVDAGVPLRPGQLVVAIGNPLGFESTVSTGVLSATDRTLPGGSLPMVQLLQHTAPLNPGNSGGPLVASNGVLLGVNTAIIPSAQGLGFSIPASTVGWVVPRLLHEGRITRGYLGLLGHTDAVRQALMDRYGLSRTAVRVDQVERGSPAARAGLEAGDLIVALDGVRIDAIATLHRRMADLRPGQSVGVSVVRAGERREITAVVAAAR